MRTIGAAILIGYVLYNIYRTLLVVCDALMHPRDRYGENTIRAIVLALVCGLLIDIWFMTSFWILRYYLRVRDEELDQYTESNLS